MLHKKVMPAISLGLLQVKYCNIYTNSEHEASKEIRANTKQWLRKYATLAETSPGNVRKQ
jgi:hypothetical protein